MILGLLEDRAVRPIDTRGALFADVSARLEKARLEIEQRFLAGGAALMAVRELVGELLDALDGIVSSLSDTNAQFATERLRHAVGELRGRIDAERRRQSELEGIVSTGATLEPVIREMKDILRHLGICAIETKIAGADSGEFLSFADDISNFVRLSDEEVTRFVSLLRQIGDQLNGLGNESGRAVAQIGEAFPTVSATLVGAVDTIDQRRRQLEKTAEHASGLMRNVQTKVGTILSALQVGDATRQRIEHIQNGIRLVSEMSEGGEDADALSTAAHRLFTVLLEALHADFNVQTRQIVVTLQSLASDAQSILALHGTLARDDGDRSPMQAVESGVATVRQLVAGIEQAHRRTSLAREETARLAGQLLDDAGSIGNLRNVRDDIRCLAINASLRCARLGAKGRAVGAIAGEINAVGDRLGQAAERVLGSLEQIRDQVAHIFDEAGGADISGELDSVAETLRNVNAGTDRHVAVIQRQGGSVVSRIAEIARDLDFGSSLGETLGDCTRVLRADFPNTKVDYVNPLIRRFAEHQIGCYTMASERDLHRNVFQGIFSSTSAGPENTITQTSAANSAEDFDDCFL